MPWDMEKLRFHELEAIERELRAIRDAQIEARRPSRRR
jgi:hypothetical protein